MTLSPIFEEESPTRDEINDFEREPQNRANTKLRGRPKPRISHRGQEFPAPRKYLRRVGYYFQHYPYDKLDRFYQLNPHLYYNYPSGYEHVQWSYPIHRTEYSRGNSCL